MVAMYYRFPRWLQTGCSKIPSLSGGKSRVICGATGRIVTPICFAARKLAWQMSFSTFVFASHLSEEAQPSAWTHTFGYGSILFWSGAILFVSDDEVEAEESFVGKYSFERSFQIKVLRETHSANISFRISDFLLLPRNFNQLWLFQNRENLCAAVEITILCRRFIFYYALCIRRCEIRHSFDIFQLPFSVCLMSVEFSSWHINKSFRLTMMLANERRSCEL